MSWRPAWVRFYGPGSYEGCPWTWKKRLRYVVMRIALGRGPLHVSVQDDKGQIYNAASGGICHPRPAELSLQKPIHVVPIEVWDGLDDEICLELPHRRFETLRAVLHSMHLLPRRHPVMNCVQATCRLIGEEEIFRTPRELLTYLESDHGRRSLRWRRKHKEDPRAN